MNTTRPDQPFVRSITRENPYASASSKTHGHPGLHHARNHSRQKGRAVGPPTAAEQPHCARNHSRREGRAVGPPTAVERLLAPLSETAFKRRPFPRIPLSFLTLPRHTPALKGLRNIAQGQPSLSEATLGSATPDREANPAHPSHAALPSSDFNASPPLPAYPSAPKTHAPRLTTLSARHSIQE